MSSVGDLKNELKKLSAEHKIEMSAIVSRSGVPIAWNLPDESMVETFATLSATIVGAAEVVYQSLGKAAPKRVMIESDGGMFVAAPIGTKALLVGISSSKDRATLTAAVDVVASAVKGVLSSE